jgi:hypothetical protein
MLDERDLDMAPEYVKMNQADAFFKYLSIGFAIVLLFGMIKYLAREKFAAVYASSPAAKIGFLKGQKLIISLSRIFLWLSPLYLFLLPWLLSTYSNLNGVVVFVCMILMVANVLVEFLFRKYLVQYLSKSN